MKEDLTAEQLDRCQRKEEKGDNVRNGTLKGKKKRGRDREREAQSARSHSVLSFHFINL